ncbi:hypothetical protein AAY473_002316 [Plecturocebus cupreus]
MWPPQERSGLQPAVQSCVITPHQVEKAPLSAASLRLFLILGSLEIVTPPGPGQAGVGGGHGHHATVHTWLGLPSGSDHLPTFSSEPLPGKQPHWRPFQKGTEPWAAPSLPAGQAVGRAACVCVCVCAARGPCGTGSALCCALTGRSLGPWYPRSKPGGHSMARWAFLAEPAASRTQVTAAGTPI